MSFVFIIYLKVLFWDDILNQLNENYIQLILIWVQ